MTTRRSEHRADAEIESFNVCLTELGEEASISVSSTIRYHPSRPISRHVATRWFARYGSPRSKPHSHLSGLAGPRIGEGWAWRRRLPDKTLPQGRGCRRITLSSVAQRPCAIGVTIGDLVVNLDEKGVEVAGARVNLTGKEYQILEILALRKGTTLSRNVSEPPLWRHGRAGIEDHRRLHLQAAQEARERQRWPRLHRDGLGRGYMLREPARWTSD